MDISILQNAIIKEDIRLLRLMFFDILGKPHYLYLPSSRLHDVFKEKIQFDGSSLQGFNEISSSDLYLTPDLKTITIYKFNTPFINIICNVKTNPHEDFLYDGRSRLQKYLKEIKSFGIQNVRMGLEIEFYLLYKGNLLDTDSYLSLPHQKAQEFFDDVIYKLKDTPIKFHSFHHEVGNGQYEINYAFGESMNIIDQVFILKEVLKETALLHNLEIDFTPKRKIGMPGNGMHLNLSIWNNHNLLYEQGHLSLLGKYFINGILKHSKEMALFSNILEASYLRLNDGKEAPKLISYGRKNRSTLIRIPNYNDEHSMRIEIRNVDESASLYFLLLLILKAGIEGIQNKCEDYQELTTSSYNINNKKEMLPSSLNEAYKTTKESEFIKKSLGNKTLEHYLSCFNVK